MSRVRLGTKGKWNCGRWAGGGVLLQLHLFAGSLELLGPDVEQLVGR